MILDNRTRYRSADLERVILLALEEAGITAHARDRVLVNYRRGLSGYCFFGFVTPGKLRSGKREARMVLGVPDPQPPTPKWRIRAHAGRCSTHDLPCTPDGSPQSPPYKPEDVFMLCPRGCRWIQTEHDRKPIVPEPVKPLDVAGFGWLVRHEVGHWRGLDHPQMHPTIRTWKAWGAAGRPLPSWAAGLEIAIEDAPPPRPKKPRVSDDERRARNLEHAIAMLKRAERKEKLAATVAARWRRRVAIAERTIMKAATKAPR